MSFYQFLKAINDGNFENMKRNFKKEYLDISENFNRGPLHCACLNGSLEIVKFLLNKGSDFNSCNVFDWRPIHYACYRGNVDIVKELCNFGCDILNGGKLGETPRNLAIENKHYECVKIIDAILEMQENIREFNVNCTLDDEEYLRSIPKFHERFNKKESLGRGGFGKVVKYFDPINGYSYAVKTIYKCKIKEDNFERNILLYSKRLDHPRIVKYFDIQIEDYKIKILMEYAEKGSLEDYIKCNGALFHYQTATFCKEILEGLAFLHKNSIIHRDIKSANILLDHNTTCKLSDFGLSRSLKTVFGSNYTDTFCGTTRYMAPELIESKRYSYPADIWSVGAVFIEMVSGNVPYSELPSFMAQKIISKTKKIEFTPAIPLTNNMVAFFENMQGEASTRSTAANLLKCAFIVWSF